MHIELYRSFFFFFQSYGDHRDLHSFPTRRSSDLNAAALQGKLNGKTVDFGDKRRGARFTVTPEGMSEGTQSAPAGGLVTPGFQGIPIPGVGPDGSDPLGILRGI